MFALATQGSDSQDLCHVGMFVLQRQGSQGRQGRAGRAGIWQTQWSQEGEPLETKRRDEIRKPFETSEITTEAFRDVKDEICKFLIALEAHLRAAGDVRHEHSKDGRFKRR